MLRSQQLSSGPVSGGSHHQPRSCEQTPARPISCRRAPAGASRRLASATHARSLVARDIARVCCLSEAWPKGIASAHPPRPLLVPRPTGPRAVLLGDRHPPHFSAVPVAMILARAGTTIDRHRSASAGFHPFASSALRTGATGEPVASAKREVGRVRVNAVITSGGCSPRGPDWIAEQAGQGSEEIDRRAAVRISRKL